MSVKNQLFKGVHAGVSFQHHNLPASLKLLLITLGSPHQWPDQTVDRVVETLPLGIEGTCCYILALALPPSCQRSLGYARTPLTQSGDVLSILVMSANAQTFLPRHVSSCA